MSGTIVEHFVKAVGAHRVRPTPFPHLAVDGVLPDDIFQRLSSDLPPFESLVLMSRAGMSSVARYERRAMLPFADVSGRTDPEVWNSIAKALDSDEAERAITRSFAPWVTEDIQNLLRRPLRREARVHCDLAGSYLTPHTDAPSMFITSFIYVRCGSPCPSLDTVLYEPLNPEQRMRELEGREYAHEDPAKHCRVGQVEFRPNRMFSFLRTSSSLHGLEAITEGGAPRYCISLHLKYAK
jgi:hypothetical protein